MLAEEIGRGKVLCLSGLLSHGSATGEGFARSVGALAFSGLSPLRSSSDALSEGREA